MAGLVNFSDVIPQATDLTPFLKSFAAMSELNLAKKKADLAEQKTLSEIALNQRMFPIEVAAKESLSLNRNLSAAKTQAALDRQNQSDKVATEFQNEINNATVVDQATGDTFQISDMLQSDDPTLRAEGNKRLNEIAAKFKGRPGTPPNVAQEIQALRKIHADKETSLVKATTESARQANTDADNKRADASLELRKTTIGQAEERLKISQEAQKTRIEAMNDSKAKSAAREQLEREKVSVRAKLVEYKNLQEDLETSRLRRDQPAAEAQVKRMQALMTEIENLTGGGAGATPSGTPAPSKLDSLLQRRKAAPVTPQAAPAVLPPLPQMPNGAMLPGVNYPGIFGSPPQINLPLAARAQMA